TENDPCSQLDLEACLEVQGIYNGSFQGISLECPFKAENSYCAPSAENLTTWKQDKDYYVAQERLCGRKILEKIPKGYKLRAAYENYQYAEFKAQGEKYLREQRQPGYQREVQVMMASVSALEQVGQRQQIPSYQACQFVLDQYP